MRTLFVVLFVLAVGCGPTGPVSGRPPQALDPIDLSGRSTVVPTVTRETLLTLPGGGVIWDLAFLPDGSALFTVRSGEVRRWRPGESTSELVANRMSAGAPLAGLFAEGQSGLMGLAIDPAFATNRRVYLYFSHETGGTKDNRVVRFRLTENFTLEDRADLVTGISYKSVGTINGGPGAHSGGRLRFGPDGFLYVTTGDNHDATIPQRLDALGSKVLRVSTDGQPAPGNPSERIWALGFRNPQGLAFHPLNGAVFIAEHGPGVDDEVTRLSAGDNGGWNPVGGDGQYNGYTGARMTDDAAVPDAVRPVWVQADSQGMSACEFLRGSSWLAWEHRLAVGFLAGRRVSVLDFNATLDATVDEDTVPAVSERVRSLVIGPDEKLYMTTDEGLIVRFSPQP